MDDSQYFPDNLDQSYDGSHDRTKRSIDPRTIIPTLVIIFFIVFFICLIIRCLQYVMGDGGEGSNYKIGRGYRHNSSNHFDSDTPHFSTHHVTSTGLDYGGGGGGGWFSNVGGGSGGGGCDFGGGGGCDTGGGGGGCDSGGGGGGGSCDI